MNTCKEIPLTKGKVAVVNAEHFQRLSLWKWHAIEKQNGFYACRSIELPMSGHQRRRFRIYMHRYLMGFPDTKQFDVHHLNSDPLDNRLENLQTISVKLHPRLRSKCETFRGGAPFSKFVGVSKNNGGKVWVAQLVFGGKRVFYRQCETELEAAIAFDAASISHHGAMGKRNYDVR